eukprot:GHRR01009204.1.p1 GENE.GHRR01009204.1~~GHRR01009204.1.p1  ORF type:complete len:287 (+),score=113.14 GHRR01009204.1:533-1393(+)
MAAADDPAGQPPSPKAWQRFYMGYKERFVHDCLIHLNSGKTVRLRQAPSANSNKRQQQQLDKQSDPALTGSTVWDGAVVLSQYLTSSGILPLGQQDGTKIVSLELGAGTGAVSLSLLAAGVVQKALITDIPDMLPHLQLNVHHNDAVLDHTKAVVRPLRWGNKADVAVLQPFKPPFDLIVGSDLIYYSYSGATPHSRLLLLALQQLAGPQSLIYLALSLHHNPGEVGNFLRWAQEDWGFAVQHILNELPHEYKVPDVLVVRLQLVDANKAAITAAAAAAGMLQRPY